MILAGPTPRRFDLMRPMNPVPLILMLILVLVMLYYLMWR